MRIVGHLLDASGLQAFQLREIVSAIAIATSPPSTGVPNRRQAPFSGLIVCSFSRRVATIGVRPIRMSFVERR